MTEPDAFTNGATSYKAQIAAQNADFADRVAIARAARLTMITGREYDEATNPDYPFVVNIAGFVPLIFTNDGCRHERLNPRTDANQALWLVERRQKAEEARGYELVVSANISPEGTICSWWLWKTERYWDENGDESPDVFADALCSALLALDEKCPLKGEV